MSVTTNSNNSVCMLKALPFHDTFITFLIQHSYFSPLCCPLHVQGDIKKGELLKNPTKIEEIQEKNIY